MTFTQHELAVLARDDAATTRRSCHRSQLKAGSRARGMLGRLTHAEAMEMHNAGDSCRRIAESAGVVPNSVTKWRRAHGLARPWRPTGLILVDRRQYHREWKRLRSPRRHSADIAPADPTTPAAPGEH